MAADLNLCCFIGRVGKHPEIKPLKNGDVMTTFSIAVNESYSDKNGQKIKKTEWINIVGYRKLAEICSKYIEKGSLVYVAGKLQINKYIGKDGLEKTSIQIVLEKLQLLSNKSLSNNEPLNMDQESSDEDDFSDIPF